MSMPDKEASNEEVMFYKIIGCLIDKAPLD